MPDTHVIGRCDFDDCPARNKLITSDHARTLVLLVGRMMHGACYQASLERLNAYIAREVVRGAAPRHLLRPGQALPAHVPPQESTTHRRKDQR